MSVVFGCLEVSDLGVASDEVSHHHVGDFADKDFVTQSGWFFQDRREHGRSDRLVKDKGRGVAIRPLDAERCTFEEAAEGVDDLSVEGDDVLRRRNSHPVAR